MDLNVDENNGLDERNETNDVVADELGGDDREVRARAWTQRELTWTSEKTCAWGGHRRGRGRRTSGGRGRGSASGVAEGMSRMQKWAPGDPLTKIWLDDDVPSELRSLVRDVISGREARAHEIEARERERNMIYNDSESENEDIEFHEASLSGLPWSPFKAQKSSSYPIVPVQRNPINLRTLLSVLIGTTKFFGT